MAKILAISNQKGGVAKTTTTMSLGAGLAEQNQRVLVVDLDSQANLTMAAGFDDHELPASLVDLFNPVEDTAETATSASIYSTEMDGLDILPADVRLAALERYLYDEPGYEYLLKKILAQWQKTYDYILLDCPPSLGAITLMALTAAQMVLVPVQCEYYAARGLTRLLEIVAEVQKRTNPTLTYRLLATLYDRRNNICRSVLEQLQGHFPEAIFETIIGVDTRLRESPATGEPVLMYAPRTRASEQYRLLTQEVQLMVIE